MQLKPAVTALVTAVALASLLSGCKKEEAAPPAQTPQVGVVTIQPQAFTLTTELPGRTTAYRIAEVRPQVNGIILKRLFKEGADVKEGQQLYQIDPSVYEATLKSAQASLTQTKSITDRYKQLVEEQAVSRQEYDTAVANRMTAEANVQTAQINVRYTKVYAPISGRIGRSSVTEGALVSNGQADAMAVIQQLDPIYVDVTQSSAEMLKLRRDLASGQLEKAGDNAAKVKLTLEDGTAYAQDGKLEFSEVSVVSPSVPASTLSRMASSSPSTSISTCSGIERYILSISLAMRIEFSVWRIEGFRLLSCTCAVSRSYSEVRPFWYCTCVSSTVRCTVASDSRSTSSDCSASRML